MKFEDETRKTFSGRVSQASWYKNLGKVYVTLSIAKAGAKTRKSAEAAARKISKTNGFPDWKCIEVNRQRDTPHLCLVIGVVE